jgi:hypothetical protein
MMTRDDLYEIEIPVTDDVLSAIVADTRGHTSFGPYCRMTIQNQSGC